MRSCGASAIAMQQWLHQWGIGPALALKSSLIWSDHKYIMGVDGACGKCAYATITKLFNHHNHHKKKNTKTQQASTSQKQTTANCHTIKPSSHQTVVTAKRRSNWHNQDHQGTSGKGSQIQGWDRAKLRLLRCSPAAFIWCQDERFSRAT